MAVGSLAINASAMNNVTPLPHLLKSHFGYDQFRPLQEEIITNVLAQKDSLV